MRIENISNGKIIGIGEVSVLPGQTQEIPEAYETSPILEVYRQNGFARITGKPRAIQKAEEKAAEKVAAERKAANEKVAAERKAANEKEATEAESLRQARLASLEGISEEDLGKLANELGINPAECKTQADVLKKVKMMLKK